MKLVALLALTLLASHVLAYPGMSNCTTSTESPCTQLFLPNLAIRDIIHPQRDGLTGRALLTPLRLLDYFGTAVFASSGAAAAATGGMDAFGALAIGTVTAIGGGTLRDALVLAQPPFWTHNVEYLYLCLLAAGATLALWPRSGAGDGPRVFWFESWADAVGVGAFAVVGVRSGFRANVPIIVQLICGVMTATFGGAVRDVALRKPIRILHAHAELYALTALAAGVVYVALRAAGAPLQVRMWAGVASAVAARWASWTWDVRLPGRYDGGEGVGSWNWGRSLVDVKDGAPAEYTAILSMV